MKKYILLLFLSGFFLNTYSQWEILNDTSFNYVFSDIRFLNNDTGFVVGDKIVISGNDIGIIGKTTNGGFDWVFIEFPTPLRAINFLNNDTGFAGGFQQILKTVDGGNSWFPIDLTLSGITNLGYAYSFWFLTNQHGYATSFYGLLETFDCGETWIYVKTIYYANIMGTDITFISDSIGYVGKGYYKTTDSGNNWDTISNYHELPQLGSNNINSCADEAYCNYYNDSIAFIIGYEILPTGSAGIYNTDDGGINWNFTSIPYMGSLNAIEFIDKDIIHIAGYTSFVFELPLPNPFFSFIKTIDGGNSWYYQESNLDTVGFIITSMEFTNDKTGYATATYWEIHPYPIGSIPHGVILKTTDGGGPMFPIPGQSYSIAEDVINEIKVYPNPASDIINIDLQRFVSRDIKIALYNINGSLVKNKLLSNLQKTNISTSNIKPGIYICEISGEDFIVRKKIVVVRE